VFQDPESKQPSPRFLCLNPLRLEAGDSRLQTRVPNREANGFSSLLPSEAFVDAI
jgi:hypothetical protein